MMELAKALLGATITKATLQDDGDCITFELAGRPPVTLRAWGDCCSQTWIESMDAPDALLGTVQSVEDIPMPDLGNIDSQRHQSVDQVAYYGLKITTEKGVCVLDYRNDSNGYYGGGLEVERVPS